MIKQTISSQTTAAMWSGTAARYVSMNPPGATASLITSAVDGVQGGTAAFGNGGRAGLWTGSPTSFVSLHPGPAYELSVLNGMSGNQQVGSALPVGLPWRQAAIWHGTAASFVNVDPPGSGGYSELLATCGAAQVGYIAPASGVFAGIWFGTAASFLNLARFLPAGYGASHATSIATDGVTFYVGGYAENEATLRNEAFLWIGAVPAPGALSLLVGGAVVAVRRRRTPTG